MGVKSGIMASTTVVLSLIEGDFGGEVNTEERKGSFKPRLNFSQPLSASRPLKLKSLMMPRALPSEGLENISTLASPIHGAPFCSRGLIETPYLFHFHCCRLGFPQPQ